MAAPVGIERGKQAVALDGLAHPAKAARRAFLLDEEHAGVLAGGIVHRHDQVPEVAGHPFMRAAVLVDHHPRHRRTFPALAVGATMGQFRHRPSRLQPVLHPRVAAS